MILSVLCPHGGIKALDTRKQNEEQTVKGSSQVFGCKESF